MPSFGFFLAMLVASAAAKPAHLAPRASCTFTDAATAIKQKASCSTITLNGIVVPAGQTLDLTGLKDNTQVWNAT
jgi:galacturan 1,4-alpha-galacturonidase